MLMLKEAVTSSSHDQITVLTLLASPLTANSHKYIWERKKRKRKKKGLVLTKSIALFPLSMWLHKQLAKGERCKWQ